MTIKSLKDVFLINDSTHSIFNEIDNILSIIEKIYNNENFIFVDYHVIDLMKYLENKLTVLKTYERKKIYKIFVQKKDKTKYSGICVAAKDIKEGYDIMANMKYKELFMNMNILGEIANLIEINF